MVLEFLEFEYSIAYMVLKFKEHEYCQHKTRALNLEFKVAFLIKRIPTQPLPRWPILVELEYHGKLEFEELEFLNCGTLLYIFETVVDPKIFCKKVVFVNDPKTMAQAWLIYKQTNMNELFINLIPVIHDRLDSFIALVRLNDESYIYATIILMTQIFS